MFEWSSVNKIIEITSNTINAKFLNYLTLILKGFANLAVGRPVRTHVSLMLLNPGL